MSETSLAKWIFPNPPCPRCRQKTYAVRTDSVNGWQYRQCRTPICPYSRKTLRVDGIRVPETPKPPLPARVTCPHCENTYSRTSALTKHINSQHGGTEDGNAEDATEPSARKDSPPDDPDAT